MTHGRSRNTERSSAWNQFPLQVLSEGLYLVHTKPFEMELDNWIISKMPERVSLLAPTPSDPPTPIIHRLLVRKGFNVESNLF